MAFDFMGNMKICNSDKQICWIKNTCKYTLTKLEVSLTTTSCH